MLTLELSIYDRIFMYMFNQDKCAAVSANEVNMISRNTINFLKIFSIHLITASGLQTASYCHKPVQQKPCYFI